jgi:hypothetical protein
MNNPTTSSTANRLLREQRALIESIARKQDQLHARTDRVHNERSPFVLSLRRSLAQDTARVVRLHRQIKDTFRAGRRLLMWWRTLSRVSPNHILNMFERVWLKYDQVERHRRHELAVLASLIAKDQARNPCD